MINPIEEIGKTTRSFFDALKDQPLSIALVLMNAMLITYLFYYTNGILTQRALTTDQIVNWQKDTDKLMANCVSKDVLETVVGALEKQLSEMRRQLTPPPIPLPLPRPSIPPPTPQEPP